MITHAHLLEILSYNRLTGEFHWLVGRSKMVAGSLAGYANKRGRWCIHIDGKHYYAHRLAWFYMNGEWPTDTIDHKDTNPLNNIFTNLRPATSKEQTYNTKAHAKTRSGLKGAFFHSRGKHKKWRSQIRAHGKLISLGYFRTAQEAHEAYARAAIKHFGEFARVA